MAFYCRQEEFIQGGASLPVPIPAGGKAFRGIPALADSARAFFLSLDKMRARIADAVKEYRQFELRVSLFSGR